MHENSFGIDVPDSDLDTIVFSCHGSAFIIALAEMLVEVKAKFFCLLDDSIKLITSMFKIVVWCFKYFAGIAML